MYSCGSAIVLASARTVLYQLALGTSLIRDLHFFSATVVTLVGRMWIVGYFRSCTSSQFQFNSCCPANSPKRQPMAYWLSLISTFEAVITPLFSLCKELWTPGWAQSNFVSSLSSSAGPPVSSPFFGLGGCTRPSLNLSLKCFNCSFEFLKVWFSTVSWLGVSCYYNINNIILLFSLDLINWKAM